MLPFSGEGGVLLSFTEGQERHVVSFTMFHVSTWDIASFIDHYLPPQILFEQGIRAGRG